MSDARRLADNLRLGSCVRLAGVMLLSLALSLPAWSQTGGGPGPRVPQNQDQPPLPSSAAIPTEVPRQVIALLSPTDPAVARQLAEAIAGRNNLTIAHLYRLVSIEATLAVFLIPDDRPPREVAVRLGREPQVMEADVNTVFETQNDPLASRQYALGLTGADRVHATLRGRNVLVAVVDSGVDAGHEDLRGAVIGGESLIEGQAQVTTDRHGTALAGVIAARRDNTMGIVGIAPEASIVAFQACEPKKPASFEAACNAHRVARGIDLAVGRHAQVLNLSLGGPRDRIVTRLVLQAILVHGLAVAAAVGNNGPGGPPLYPAALPDVIAVGATDNRDTLYVQSNLGRHVGIFAPGVDVLTTQPKNGYVFVTGTSYAAAYVSGALAVLLEAAGAQDLSSARLRDALQRGAARMDGQNVGRLHLCGSLASMGRSDACR